MDVFPPFRHFVKTVRTKVFLHPMGTLPGAPIARTDLHYQFPTSKLFVFLHMIESNLPQIC